MSPYWNRTGRICEAHEADPIDYGPEEEPDSFDTWPWWAAAATLWTVALTTGTWLPVVQAWWGAL